MRRIVRARGSSLELTAAWRLILRPSSAANAFRERARRPWRLPPLHAREHGLDQLSGLAAEQLLLAPQELRTADPSFATELYNGHFGLAGRLAELNANSPFEIVPPSEGWERELYGFGWLRHLRAAGSELSREQAKALVERFRAAPPLDQGPCLAAGDRRAAGHLLAIELGADPR